MNFPHQPWQMATPAQQASPEDQCGAWARTYQLPYRNGRSSLDSIPMVCIVGDVARGEKYRPFQVHELPMEQLLKAVTKEVISVATVDEIPCAIRTAFMKAKKESPARSGFWFLTISSSKLQGSTTSHFQAQVSLSTKHALQKL